MFRFREAERELQLYFGLCAEAAQIRGQSYDFDAPQQPHTDLSQLQSRHDRLASLVDRRVTDRARAIGDTLRAPGTETDGLVAIYGRAPQTRGPLYQAMRLRPPRDNVSVVNLVGTSGVAYEAFVKSGLSRHCTLFDWLSDRANRAVCPAEDPFLVKVRNDITGLLDKLLASYEDNRKARVDAERAERWHAADALLAMHGVPA